MALDPNSVPPDRTTKSEPLWRKQFPIDTARETSATRRAFLGGVTVAGGAMACSHIAMNAANPPPPSEDQIVDASEDSGWTEHPPLTLDKKLHDLADGEALLFHFPDHRSPCLLVKFADNDFVAYSQKCTHLACPVVPEPDRNRFHCPCHHGSFDIRTGQPTGGPPRIPLPRIRVEVSVNGTLVATAVHSTA